MTDSARLNEHTERAAEMVGVRERLKLADLLRVELRKKFFLHGLAQNAREKLRLGAISFRYHSGGFAGFLDRGKIDVRGQILSAGVGQDVIGDLMAKICAQRAVGARG